MRRNNKRRQLLDAALHVVERSGANHLTLDAVAAAAGISKGGLLYHFASKEELLKGMLDHLLELNHERVETADADSRLGALLEVESAMTEGERRASLALLAAVAENANLLKPARSQMEALFRGAAEVGAETFSMEAVTLLLANEGLRFLNILELNPMTDEEAQAVRAHLREQARALTS